MTLYSVTCDGRPPGGCAADLFEHSDYSCVDEESLAPYLDDADWVTSEDGSGHLCPDCRYALVIACELLTGIEL